MLCRRALAGKLLQNGICLLGLDDMRISLKNDPEKNVQLRAEYPAIYEGYHLNKQHWNTIELNGTVPPGLIMELINDSYQLIIVSLPKKKQEEFKNMS